MNIRIGKKSILTLLFSLLFLNSNYSQNKTTTQNPIKGLNDRFKQHLLKPEYKTLIEEKNFTPDSLIKHVEDLVRYFPQSPLQDSIIKYINELVLPNFETEFFKTYATLYCLEEISFYPNQRKHITNVYFNHVRKTTDIRAFISSFSPFRTKYSKLLEENKNNIKCYHPYYKQYYYPSCRIKLIDSVSFGNGKLTEYYESGKLKGIVFYKEGKQHGKIRFWYETGELSSEADFIMGTGKSKSYYRSGKLKMEKEYRDGKLNGTYKSWYESGKPESEQLFKDDLENGKIRFWYETGELSSEADFIMGTGKSKSYYRSGKLKMEKEYRDGKLNGTYKSWYESGKPESEQLFKDDLENGKIRFWYETGELKGEANYVMGTGKLTRYYRSGKVEFESYYKNGKKDGPYKSWYESGKPESEQFFMVDLWHGDYLSWDESTGKVQNEGNFYMGTGKLIKHYNNKRNIGFEEYRDGILHGKSQYLYFNNEPLRTGEFISGTGNYKCLYLNGAINESGNLVNGKLNGDWSAYYKTGVVKGKAKFYDGRGIVTYYYQNGNKMFEGYYSNGKFEGEGLWFYPSGKLKIKTSFNSEGDLDENIRDSNCLIKPSINGLGNFFPLQSGLIKFVSLINQEKISVTNDISEELTFYKRALEDEMPEYVSLMKCFDGGLGYLMAEANVQELIQDIDRILKDHKK
jgi:antitoxin component YwqK of YwqJK toxin-antitoxin module